MFANTHTMCIQWLICNVDSPLYNSMPMQKLTSDHDILSRIANHTTTTSRWPSCLRQPRQRRMKWNRCSDCRRKYLGGEILGKFPYPQFTNHNV